MAVERYPENGPETGSGSSEHLHEIFHQYLGALVLEDVLSLRSTAMELSSIQFPGLINLYMDTVEFESDILVNRPRDDKRDNLLTRTILAYVYSGHEVDADLLLTISQLSGHPKTRWLTETIKPTRKLISTEFGIYSKPSGRALTKLGSRAVKEIQQVARLSQQNHNKKDWLLGKPIWRFLITRKA
ncbi:MAG TPA: hypothetical protein VNE40_04050 [Candidatus Dormibacteraeota bacterium]|nr:hypothetical protein [Candidatus Dormibacteraeota bacterium]